MKRVSERDESLFRFAAASNALETYQKLRKKETHPPLLQKESWTLAVPYREQMYCREPCETIANNYTPTARNLTLATVETFGLKKLKQTNAKKRVRRTERRLFKVEKHQWKTNGYFTNREAEDRPLSPIEQKRIIDEVLPVNEVPLRDEDWERYWHYVVKEIDDECIAKDTFCIANIVSKYISEELKTLSEFRNILSEISLEVEMDYVTSVKISIANYVLRDEEEKKRLRITHLPHKFTSRTFRGSFPWHRSYLQQKKRCEKSLFITSPTILSLKKIWETSYSSFRFVDIKELEVRCLPCTVLEFSKYIKTECQKSRKHLIESWIHSCINKLILRRCDWAPLVPNSANGSLHRVESFFATVAATMSFQLRSAAITNLDDWIFLLKRYKISETEDTIDAIEERKTSEKPVMIIKATVVENKIQLQPNMSIVEEHLHQFVEEIIYATQNIPKVEKLMFPEMADWNLFLFPISISDVIIKKDVQQIKDIFEVNVNCPLNYLELYSEFEAIIDGSAFSKLHDYLSSNPSTVSLKQKLTEIKRTSSIVRKKPSTVYLNVICLDCSILNEYLITQSEEMWSSIINFKLEENRLHTKQICETYEEMSKKLTAEPTNIAELFHLHTYFEECKTVIHPNLLQEMKSVGQGILFLLDYPVFSEIDIQINTKMFTWSSSIKKVFNACKIHIKNQKEEAEKSLLGKRKHFKKVVRALEEQVESFKTMENLNMNEIKNNVLLLDDLQSKLQETTLELEKMNEEEILMGWKKTEIPLLSSFSEKINPFSKLWHTTFDFMSKYEKWFKGPVHGINPLEIEEQIEAMWNIIIYLDGVFKPNTSPKHVVDYLIKTMKEFKNRIPILKAICNPGLKQRHWKKIGTVMGTTISPSVETSLSDMVKLDMANYIAEIEEISNSARKEFSFENAMNKMKNDWKDLQLELIPYNDSDVELVASCEEIQLLLDEHILKIQTIGGSPFSKDMKDEIKSWETTLLLIQDIVDAWQKCQFAWMYLEPIFNSEDIMRQMPEEAEKFDFVNKICCNVIKDLKQNNNVLLDVCNELTLKQLNKANSFLEDIQKGLNDYLEKKRMQFPRFYFLSNDELLEILSETKEPQRVQPHIKKCFEGIAQLQFMDDDEIVGMISSEDEVVPFSQHIFPEQAKGMVERWISEVEKVMVKSLRDITDKALNAYSRTDEKKWLSEWPGQVVHCCMAILWTAETAKCIIKGNVQKCISKYNETFEMLIHMIKGNLILREKLKFETLIIIFANAKQIVEKLANDNISSINDFVWISQLRYYWENEKIKVSMINSTLNYGFEYLGNSSRLIITPLTERCYSSMMMALKLHLGVIVQGPSSSGKSETCKDFSKAIGKQFVVFNCSHKFTSKAMGKLFKGLVQTGTWLCFDKFNLLELEVLSVISQQMQLIHSALKQNLRILNFDGKDLHINPNCAIFAIMNPFQSQKIELPYNLKAMFRPVAMISPDISVICRVYLYLAGFSEAKWLAQKITILHELCTHQLLNYYDFGICSIKSVLIQSRNLRNRYSSENESAIIVQALDDVNLSKLSAKDIYFYKAIKNEVFPNVLPLEFDHCLLNNAIILSCLQKYNLQPTIHFIQKIKELYQLLLQKHGIIITGKYMSGKTSAYKILASILGEISEKNNACNVEEFKVSCSMINPKSMTLNQLFGTFHSSSSEWIDGIIASLFHQYAKSKPSERKWIVFDGPVDLSWIENLSTLLDHNKKLCLGNGDMIYLTNKMNLLFEVEELENASPSFISCCGVVMMDSEQLEWRALKDCYLNTLPDFMRGEHKMIMHELFEWLFPSCFLFIDEQIGQEMKISVNHYFQSFANLFNCLLKTVSSDNDKLLSYVIQINVNLQILFVFCILWVFGGIVNDPTRTMFAEFYKEILNGENTNFPKPKVFSLTKSQLFPENGLLYDFFYDFQNCKWRRWIDYVQNIQVPEEIKLDHCIIPTNASTYLQYFLQLYISHEIPVLLIGGSSSGKTALITDLLHKLPNDQYISNWICLSQCTTANQLQNNFIAKLDKRRRGVVGPCVGKKCVVFIDDLNKTESQAVDSGCPVELLRQWFCHGYWYDLKDSSTLDIADVQFVSAASISNRSIDATITYRFLHYLNILGVDVLSEETIIHIFTSFAERNFLHRNFPKIKDLAKSLVLATLSVYSSAINSLLAIPSKCHYIFSLKNLVDVMKGIFMTTVIKGKLKFIRLWIHEVYRVFFDRLNRKEDRELFFNFVKEATFKYFNESVTQVFKCHSSSNEKIKDTEISDILFGDYLTIESGNVQYDEIVDENFLMSSMENYLQSYNKKTAIPLNIVMFTFVIQHFSRICRVLKQDKGHILLIGNTGSGRRSITRLAAFVKKYELIEIKICSFHSRKHWRDNLKKVLYKSGAEGKPTVFLLNCDFNKEKSFLEDINMILKTGDIPDLFSPEEKAEILEKMQSAINELKWPDDALEIIARKLLSDTVVEESILNGCVQLCKHFHQHVSETSNQYDNYVACRSYINLLTTFKKILKDKQEELVGFRNRYKVGLEKLELAASQVLVMQHDLTTLQPQLIDTSHETEKLMVKIEQDTVEVEAKKEVVAADEALANKAAAAAQAMKDECVKDLSEAVPAMESAVLALNTLKSQDITVIRSLKNPPSGVKLVMEAICVMKGIKPLRTTDTSGNLINDYWTVAQKMLGDLKFLDGLKQYDKDNIPDQVMRHIREKYIQNQEFDPAIIRRMSHACEGLCRWVKAVDIYDRVSKVVAPKKAKLAKAEEDLVCQMKRLAEKKKELQKVTDKLQTLNDEFASMTKRKKELEDSIEITSKKLERAERLLNSLEGEKNQWAEIATQLLEQYNNILGDVLLSSAMITYLGSFNSSHRNDLIKQWHSLCGLHSIPSSIQFSLADTLGNPEKIREWHSLGLPMDNFTIENIIITLNSPQWCLAIDPYEQAKQWITHLKKDDKLLVTKSSKENFINVLENAINSGIPILLENDNEVFDPILESLLGMKVFIKSGNYCLNIGEKEVKCSSKFELFITTRLYNPFYRSEIRAQVNIVNFAVTQMGLENLLLKIVASKELPKLEERRNLLIAEHRENKKKLQEIEKRILKILSSSKGNILEDERAIRILSSSKTLSEEIRIKQEASSIAQKEINEARNIFYPVALQSSEIFFCVSSMAKINTMYRYSLSWFLDIYLQSILESKKMEDITERISSINSHFVEKIHEKISYSLEQKHKLLFSFLLCISITSMRNVEEYSALKYLLGKNIPEHLVMDPSPNWLSPQSWYSFVHASDLLALKGLKEHVQEYPDLWIPLCESDSECKIILPDQWSSLSGLNKLVVLKCLGNDRFISGTKEFVLEKLGKRFVYPPVFSFSDVYKDTNCQQPIVIYVSPNANPDIAISNLKKELDQVISKIHFISITPPHETSTKLIIEESMRSGAWVVLQNCHENERMHVLEDICEEIGMSESLHKDFRLWITTHSFAKFPVSVLLNAIKVKNEAPTRLKDSMQYVYKNSHVADIKFYNGCSKEKIWEKVVFSLSCYHSIVQERRSSLYLEWYLPYKFNECNFHASLLQIQNYLNEQSNISLPAIKHIIGECNYYGEIFDDLEERIMTSLLSKYINNDVIYGDTYSFSQDNIYISPLALGRSTFTDYIDSLPSCTSPEFLGLDDNTFVLKNLQQTEQFLSDLWLIQGEVCIERTSLDIASDILNKIPAEFDITFVTRKYPLHYTQFMNTLLYRELICYNSLLSTIRYSLQCVQKVAMGHLTLTTELEKLIDEITLQRIPSLWIKKSYPSLNNIGNYIQDLLKRVNFFSTWISKGQPVVVWLSAFYFPKSLLIGFLVSYSQMIDVLATDLRFLIEIPQQEMDDEKEGGLLIQGLYLEGAHWDFANNKLTEQLPRICYDLLPVVWLKPKVSLSETTYSSPLYRLSNRSKALLPGYQLFNYLVNVNLPSTKTVDHWIQREVTMFCQRETQEE